MRVFQKSGSKQRLFEMMERVNGLNENILSKEKKDEIINKFINDVCKYLDIENNNIEISYEPNEAAKMSSFGKNTPSTNTIRVVALNRNLADVLRTLAHELVHRKQKKEGRLYSGAGDDGSDIENEANSEAALIMRRFGKANPIIFE